MRQQMCKRREKKEPKIIFEANELHLFLWSQQTPLWLAAYLFLSLPPSLPLCSILAFCSPQDCLSHLHHRQEQGGYFRSCPFLEMRDTDLQNEPEFSFQLCFPWSYAQFCSQWGRISLYLKNEFARSPAPSSGAWLSVWCCGSLTTSIPCFKLLLMETTPFSTLHCPIASDSIYHLSHSSLTSSWAHYLPLQLLQENVLLLCKLKHCFLISPLH